MRKILNKVKVYYIGRKGANMKKVDDLLHAYRPDHFEVILAPSVKYVATKVLSFRDFVILDLNFKPENTIAKLAEAHKTLKRIGCTSICLTNAVDHNTVSSIAEIGFDGVLVKPFNFRSFKNVIDHIKEFTFESNKYFLTIEKGKRALYDETNYTKSYTIFKKSTEQDTTPSLAYFYLGKTCEYMNRDVNAINHYRRSLRLNKWHFQSLNSLLEVYIRHKDKDEAFTLLKHLTRTYPESPERFCMAVQLAVKTFQFDEIPALSEAYEMIKNRNSKIDKYFFAALYVSAKHYLNKKKIDQANIISKKLLDFSHNSPYYKSLIKQAYKSFGNGKDFDVLESQVA